MVQWQGTDYVYGTSCVRVNIKYDGIHTDSLLATSDRKETVEAKYALLLLPSLYIQKACGDKVKEMKINIYYVIVRETIA